MSGARREVGAPDAGRDQAPGAGRRFTMAAQRSPGWTGPAIVGPRWWVRSAIRWYRPFSPPDDLHDTLVCSWDATVGGRHRLIPDGCVDLLWLDGGGGGDGRLTVCGPELRSWSFALPTGTRAVGVR